MMIFYSLEIEKYLERSLWRSRFVQNLEVDRDQVLADAVLGEDSVGTLVRPIAK